MWIHVYLDYIAVCFNPDLQYGIFCVNGSGSRNLNKPILVIGIRTLVTSWNLLKPVNYLYRFVADKMESPEPVFYLTAGAGVSCMDFCQTVNQVNLDVIIL
jgi:hypothetical protein